MRKTRNFTRYQVTLDLTTQTGFWAPSFSVVAKTKEDAISRAEAKAVQLAKRWDYGEFKASGAKLEWCDGTEHIEFFSRDDKGWNWSCGWMLFRGEWLGG